MSKPPFIYFSHKFGGDKNNKYKLEDYIKELVTKYEFIPISPIHNTGFLYDVVSYEKGIDWCIKLLSLASAMVVFGADSNSKGCLLEKDYCVKHNIPVVEYSDFDNWYKTYIGGNNDE